MSYEPMDGLGAELGDGGVLQITIERPDREGSIDDATGQALIGHLVGAGQDEAVRSILLRNEAFALELSSRSEDFREGLAAFRQKREPDFVGR